MAEEPLSGEVPAADELRVRFHYIKSPAFRVIHVDGVIGSPAPNGKMLQLGVFSERLPIPQQTTHDVHSDGSLGDEVLDERVAKVGVIREVEAELLLDEQTATRLRGWLDKMLQQWQDIKSQMSAMPDSGTDDAHIS